ncbi:hypothetical protein RMAECT_0052 [Rickettsia rhipicephali str. Ect]|uniref:Uncharacterized protein n=1 Tax=Rickettsia rhipicephali str. Ect TaxID=1359199 RepID=A0A0F3PGX8_RICRH|nr:hypothetical protein RMAECT_0052 [Rickettsia rhipicephali str. Ect]
MWHFFPSLREDAIGVDEEISGTIPEIATLLAVARNDVRIYPRFS